MLALEVKAFPTAFFWLGFKPKGKIIGKVGIVLSSSRSGER